MFLRELKVKSNNQLKRTELKALRDAIYKSYPVLTEQDLDAILPKKEHISLLKVECYQTRTSTKTILVYATRTKTIFFESDGDLLPTVFLLWEFPNLLSLSFTTYENVISHMSSGADLMMPGVVVPPQGYGAFEVNRPAYVNLNSNSAAIAVGRTAQNSYELMRSRTGRCVQVLHIYGDKLCTLLQSSVSPAIPNLGPPHFLNHNKLEHAFTTLLNGSNEKDSNPSSVEEIQSMDQLTIKTEVELMDELLIRCLLTVLKYSKSLKLPVLTSNLYKQMMEVCPKTKTLDIKKSQYKKVGVFIRDMSKLGLLTTKEEKKGVEMVTEYNERHELFTDFYLDKCERPVTESPKGTGPSNEKKILEGYIITPSTARFFQNFRLQKGQTVQAADIRKHVTDFVRKNDLQDQEDKSLVHPRGELADLIKTTAPVTWLQLMERIFEIMRPCYTVSTDCPKSFQFQQDTVVKGKLEPINMTIQRRSGNKKVTLVDNLELYGINILSFSKECQRRLAVSTTLLLPPGKKSQRLLLQGNHIEYLHHLLKDEFKIHERYMRGLEFADKKKQ